MTMERKRKKKTNRFHSHQQTPYAGKFHRMSKNLKDKMQKMKYEVSELNKGIISPKLHIPLKKY
jgi:hypothetical protein